jgi:hypothetical protein
MLGRKDYHESELDNGRRAIETELEAYRRLVAAVEKSGSKEAQDALEAFEPLFSNSLVLVLDRYYVHRLRGVTGKDGNPLNEVELLAESLMNNDGVFRGNNVVKYVPDASVTRIAPDDRITLTADVFDGLQTAFFADLQRKFVKG